MDKKETGGFIAYLKGDGLQKVIAVGCLIVLYVFFSIFGNHFLTSDTLVSILDSSYYIGFLAIGMTFVVITGGIDLSCGTVMVGSALIGGVAYNVWHVPVALSILLVLISAILFGFCSGLLVGKLGLPPFIATLGMQFISLGICSVIAKVQTQTWPSLTSEDGWFKRVIYKNNGFPVGAIWLIVFFVIGWILLNKTILGRYTYAMGSNEEAVELSGIKTSNWKVIVYVVNGFFVGLAGIIYAATYSTITPQTGGGRRHIARRRCRHPLRNDPRRLRHLRSENRTPVHGTSRPVAAGSDRCRRSACRTGRRHPRKQVQENLISDIAEIFAHRRSF